MHLYQHSTRCPTVVQMFLNCYPRYWIFVPMPSQSARQQNIILPIVKSETNAATRSTNSTENFSHSIP